MPNGRKRRLSDAPKPVVKRWWSRKLHPKAQAIARAYMRWKLPKTERVRQEALAAAFETTKRFAIRFENSRLNGTRTIYNIGLYLLIADRDIQAMKIDALTHPDEWTRKLCARVILLTIYEWDADKVCGKALKEAFELLETPDDLQARTIACVRGLRTIQNKARKFTDIRNSAIAHRDANALTQYRAIRDLNVKDVWELGAEFFAQVQIFIQMLTQILQASDPTRSVLRQWAASEKSERDAITPR
jgi:hypothetical protein